MFLGQDRRPRLIWRILLAWLGFFGCVLIIGMTVQAATARLPPVISHAAAGLGITASALGLVLLLRRQRVGLVSESRLVVDRHQEVFRKAILRGLPPGY